MSLSRCTVAPWPTKQNDLKVGSEARLHGPESQCVDLAAPLLLHLYNGLMTIVEVPTKGLS